MSEASPHLNILRDLAWVDLFLVLLVLAGCRLLIALVRWVVRRTAENVPSHRRLLILRAAPIARLLIGIAGIAIVIPILVEPNFEDVVALLATVGLALAFALKDYVSCLVAGVVTILENTYQPGDWIEVDGTYGEVKAIGTRAVHIVTSDDTEVIIPHARIWSTSIFNASSGNQSLLCVANFYLHADHDGHAVCKTLDEIASTSSYRKAEMPVKVVAAETPWGTHYKLKAYVRDSREQFAMITDLTVRAKERLLAMDVKFAQALYVEDKHH
jgi:small conductance mechanosensitive channel